MGPLVARALDPRRMTLARKDVAEYAGVAIPFYERWAHRHEFLLRCQQRGETVEEYFQAKRELLVEGNTYGDMMAAYLAYWSGLQSWELVVLMDARVLGRVWSGQIMGRDPQIEEWATDTPPQRGGPATVAVRPGRPASRVVADTSFPLEWELRPAGGEER